jgi:hypothetical protein
MVRWMCGITLKDRKSSKELSSRLRVKEIVDVTTRGRLLCGLLTLNASHWKIW